MRMADLRAFHLGRASPLCCCYVAAALLLAVIAPLAAVLLMRDETWDRERLGGDSSTADRKSSGYCEAVRDGLLRERANAFSNVAYVLSSIVICACAIRDAALLRDLGAGSRRAAGKARQERLRSANLLVAVPLYSALLAFNSAALGACSFFFHASLTRFAQQLDVGALYGTLLFFPAYTFHMTVVAEAGRWQRVADEPASGRAKLWATAVAWTTGLSVVGQLLATSMLTKIKWETSAVVLCPALLGTFVLLFAYWLCRRPSCIQWTAGVPVSSATFLWACLAWAIDKRDSPITACRGPQSRASVLQLHAAFHALSAASIVLAYMTLRSVRMLRAEHRPDEEASG